MVLLYGFVRLIHRTYRFKFVGLQNIALAKKLGQGSYLLAIWHQNLLGGILAQTGTRHVVIISRSKSGDGVSMLCEKLGHRVIRGSSKRDGVDKGGKLAKDEIIQVLKGGTPGAITVDGPTGPAHVIKPGIIEMARLAGVPIVPYLPIAQRYWSFNSWDRFRFPKPFTRIVIHYGTPVSVSADATFEDFPVYQRLITEQLHALESQYGKSRVRGAKVRPKPARATL